MTDYTEGPEVEVEEDEGEELEGFARILDEVPSNLASLDEEAFEAFYDNQPSYWDSCDVEDFWSEFEDAYQGTWSSDEEFAQEMAEMSGYRASNEWPYYCINWDFAARELMYDYFESGGYYFRR
jgi:antirestriction protein